MPALFHIWFDCGFMWFSELRHQLLEYVLKPHKRCRVFHSRSGRNELWELDDPPAIFQGIETRGVGRRILRTGIRFFGTRTIVDGPSFYRAVQCGIRQVEDQDLLLRHDRGIVAEVIQGCPVILSSPENLQMDLSLGEIAQQALQGFRVLKELVRSVPADELQQSESLAGTFRRGIEV